MNKVLAQDIGTAALSGATVATIINYIRRLKDDAEQRQYKKDKNEGLISDDTIVVRLPKSKIRQFSKTSSARDSFESVSDPTETSEIAVSEDSSRDTKGRFLPKWITKDAGVWSSLKNTISPIVLPVSAYLSSNQTVDSIKKTIGSDAARVASLPIAALAGFYAIDKIAKKLEKNRLKRQIDDAQQIYIDKLSKKGEEKTAGFTISDISDAAVNGAAHVTGTTLGIGALLALAGAYATRRYLKEKYGKKYNPEKFDNRVKILFKEGSCEKEITPEHALAFIGIHADVIKNAEFEKDAGLFDGVKRRKTNELFNSFMASEYGDKARHEILNAYLQKNPEMAFQPISDMISQYSGKGGSGKPSKYAKDPVVLKQLKKNFQDDFLKNRKHYFDLLGDSRHDRVRDSFVNDAINNRTGNWLMKHMPSLEGTAAHRFVNSMIGTVMDYTGQSSKKQAKGAIRSMYGNVPENILSAILSKYSFGRSGWNSKTAAAPSLGQLASLSIITDSTNQELGEKIEGLSSKITEFLEEEKNRQGKTKKPVNPRAKSGVDVFASEDVARKLVKNKKFIKWMKENNGFLMQ